MFVDFLGNIKTKDQSMKEFHWWLGSFGEIPEAPNQTEANLHVISQLLESVSLRGLEKSGEIIKVSIKFSGGSRFPRGAPTTGGDTNLFLTFLWKTAWKWEKKLDWEGRVSLTSIRSANKVHWHNPFSVVCCGVLLANTFVAWDWKVSEVEIAGH